MSILIIGVWSTILFVLSQKVFGNIWVKSKKMHQTKKMLMDLLCRYGENVVCNILYPCQLDEENLICRQRSGKNQYLQVEISFWTISVKISFFFNFKLKRCEKESDAIYALDPNWFHDWGNFVCEKSSEIPVPISNSGIFDSHLC